MTRFATNLGTSATNLVTFAANLVTFAANLVTFVANLVTNAPHLARFGANHGKNAPDLGKNAANQGTNAAHEGKRASRRGRKRRGEARRAPDLAALSEIRVRSVGRAGRAGYTRRLCETKNIRGPGEARGPGGMPAALSGPPCKAAREQHRTTGREARGRRGTRRHWPVY